VDFFTADLHLGYASIMKYCRRTAMMTPADRESFAALPADQNAPAFRRWKPSRESVAIMDRVLLDNINAAVGELDRLWIVGDFANPAKATPAALAAYRRAIRCRDLRLVWGNHDPRHLVDGLFTATYETARLFITDRATHVEADLWSTHALRSKRGRMSLNTNCRIVFLSHYAHVVWHHSDRGVYHLYGHSHGNLEPWRERHMPGAPSLDVGADCWDYRPLSIRDIDRILTPKRALSHKVDHRAGGLVPAEP
jgi:calcineurin-like phosphoesterase family protein